MKYHTALFCFTQLFSFFYVAHCGNEDRLFYDAVRSEASGNLDQAINHYLEASKISHSANLYGNLANLFFKKKQFGQAILYFRKALLIEPRNNELSVNLEFAYEMANTPAVKKDFASSYFSEKTISFWCLFSALIFWFGLLFVIYIFFFKTHRTFLLCITVCWTSVLGISLYATNLSLTQKTELNREIIAYISDKHEKGQQTVSLRRFAGETNSENTTILPGESLVISLGKNQINKSHRSSDGVNWFLVRSKDGKKKGWIREDEFGWIINPNSES